jgi:Tol biopolymer transport system component
VHWYAISPDGSRLAFVRGVNGESVLMISNIDGTGEYRLSGRSTSAPYSFLSWSPNNDAVAAAVGSREVSGEQMYPVEVDVSSGAERELTPQRWVYLSFVLYTVDGTGLIVNGSDLQTSISGAWHVSRGDGKTVLLTSELPEVYEIQSRTSDSHLFTGQTLKLDTNIWIAKLGERPAEQARQITSANDGGQVGFMPDGRILFTTLNSRSQPDIWLMNADGSERRQLTAETGNNTMPFTSPDGRYIVFNSDRTGTTNIWRMDADGGNPKQLTFGQNEKGPTISPDGKWIAFTMGEESTIWRMPVDGGSPQKLGAGRASYYSPDGRWVVTTAGRHFRLLPADGGEALRTFKLPEDMETNGHGGRWAPDSSGFIFVGCRDGFWNIYIQEIAGGKVVQLTDFESTDQIFSPDFSPDGKDLIFSRGGWRFDIYLFRVLEGREHLTQPSLFPFAATSGRGLN